MKNIELIYSQNSLYQIALAWSFKFLPRLVQNSRYNPKKGKCLQNVKTSITIQKLIKVILLYHTKRNLTIMFLFCNNRRNYFTLSLVMNNDSISNKLKLFSVLFFYSCFNTVFLSTKSAYLNDF